MRRPDRGRPPCPTESTEQRMLFTWARLQAGRYPELGLLYHIPNEGKRSNIMGARMRAEGMRSGVPDVCLPVARGGFSGLYIELKRQRGGRVSENQQAWIDALRRAGNRAEVCKGWEAAKDVILDYLNKK